MSIPRRRCSGFDRSLLLFTTRVTSNVTNHMIVVAVGYQVYELTDSASLLGLIGLAQFLPPLLLMLFAGQVADRFNRRHVLRCCYAVELCAALGFLTALAAAAAEHRRYLSSSSS